MITLLKTQYNNLEIEYAANIENEDTLVITTSVNSNKLVENHFHLWKYKDKYIKFNFSKLNDSVNKALKYPCEYKTINDNIRRYIIDNYLDNGTNNDMLLFTKLKKYYENALDNVYYSRLIHYCVIDARSRYSMVKDSNCIDDNRPFDIYLFPYYDDGDKKLFIASKFKNGEVKHTKIKLSVLQCNCDFYEEAFNIISLIEKFYVSNPIRLHAILIKTIVNSLETFYDKNSFVDISELEEN